MKDQIQFFIIGAADLGRLPKPKQALSACCTKAGVPKHCIGLCTPVQSAARSLGNRINACTEYDEDIEKCWEQVLNPDKNGELLLQFLSPSVPLISCHSQTKEARYPASFSW